jgi:hypothetical protein
MADLIVVVNQGRVIEVGSHQELVQKAGPYAELFDLQARGYAWDERANVLRGPAPQVVAGNPAQIACYCAGYWTYSAMRRLGEWRTGTSPARSLRTGRDSLPSSGPHRPACSEGNESPVDEELRVAAVDSLQPTPSPAGTSCRTV